MAEVNVPVPSPDSPAGPAAVAAPPSAAVAMQLPEVPQISELVRMYVEAREAAPPPRIEFRSDDVANYFTSLDEEIRDILIREAYMARAAEIISQQQAENLRELERVQATRPPFMMLRAGAKAEFTVNLQRAENEVTFFSQAMKQNERAMENLRKAARRLLEVWLRNHDTTYMNGLACELFLKDWRNAMAQVNKIVLDFIEAIGEARNLMVTGYDRDTAAYSPQALEALRRAARVGAALEADCASVNAIAEKHNQMFAGSIFEDPFPLLPLFAAELHTDNARLRPIGLLQRHFDRIKGYYEELQRDGVPALSAAVDRVEQRRASVGESYMTILWEGLRHEARKQVKEDDLLTIARETEERFLQGEYT